MKNSNMRSALLTSCVLAPCFLQPLAMAQEGDLELQAVIVTTLKQDETLLETPATVSVVDADKLEQLSITSADQLSGVVPGFVSMQGTTGTSAAFRGLGSTGADPSIESSVSMFIDGVYLGHVRDFVTPLYDIDQVEFIPGTQSTLLGKNTSIGAVSVVNRRPGEAFGYDFSAMAASGLEGTRVHGGVDVPLGSGFAARLAGFWNDEDGAVNNVFLQRSERQVSDHSGRFTLSGPMGNSGSIDFIMQHDERDTLGHNLEPLTDPNGDLEGLGRAFGHPDFDVAANDRSYAGSEALAPGETSGPDQFDKQTTDRVTLIGQFELGNGLTFTSHSGYVAWNSQRVTDLDFTLGNILNLIDDEENEILSQEFRISSDDDGQFSYLAGVLFYHNDWALNRAFFAQSAGGALELAPGLPFEGVQDGKTGVETRAWSAFASGQYDLSSRWGLRAGLRYTDEEKSGTFERSVTDLFTIVGAPIALETLPAQRSREVDGDVGVQFYPNDDTMLYATFARGSKSGGYQSTPDTLQVAGFDQEIAYTIEAGAKFDFGSSRSATFAVFDTKVDGFQISRIQEVGGINQIIIDNADIRSIGAEGAFDWQATEELKFTGGVTFTQAEFTQDLFSDDGSGGFTLEAFDGMRLVRAPRWTGQLGAEYETALTADLSLRANALVRYASDADLQLRAANPLAPRSEAHTTLDAKLALGAQGAGWELALIGNNLTDERYVTFTSDAPLSDGGYYGTLSRPQTLAVQLSIAR